MTVMSGSFYIGMSGKTDPHVTRAMADGTYGFGVPGMAHFVIIEGETVAQFHGIGPWSIKYVNPVDHPRNPISE